MTSLSVIFFRSTPRLRLGMRMRMRVRVRVGTGLFVFVGWPNLHPNPNPDPNHLRFSYGVMRRVVMNGRSLSRVRVRIKG